MAFESHGTLAKQRQRSLFEAPLNVPFGTMVGWKTPAGEVYGVVVSKAGKDLLCLTSYDKTLKKDPGLRFYRDEALSGKLAPLLPSVMMDLQRVPAVRAFVRGRITGSALKTYTQAAASLQLEGALPRRGRSEDMDFTKTNTKLDAIRKSLDEDAAESAFKQELRTWAVNEFEGFMKDLDKKMLAIKKGKWPTHGMEYAVTRYRPNKMTQEDFIDEVMDHYLSWRGNMKRAAKTE